MENANLDNNNEILTPGVSVMVQSNRWGRTGPGLFESWMCGPGDVSLTPSEVYLVIAVTNYTVDNTHWCCLLVPGSSRIGWTQSRSCVKLKTK